MATPGHGLRAHQGDTALWRPTRGASPIRSRSPRSACSRRTRGSSRCASPRSVSPCAPGAGPRARVGGSSEASAIAVPDGARPCRTVDYAASAGWCGCPPPWRRRTREAARPARPASASNGRPCTGERRSSSWRCPLDSGNHHQCKPRSRGPYSGSSSRRHRTSLRSVASYSVGGRCCYSPRPSFFAWSCTIASSARAECAMAAPARISAATQMHSMISSGVAPCRRAALV